MLCRVVGSEGGRAGYARSDCSNKRFRDVQSGLRE